ncbi:hypothetical protein D9756_000571 [Leucocoprinus leucothites]|uniref:Uncharacterized protein n=1 Tax=Leucocoprinus leucothites TaxID=201217 RepID=A0A8H5GFW3_9AGAR|nr:hypothetical protein D9756_000571 [Leucoagaricus leucothites]
MLFYWFTVVAWLGGLGVISAQPTALSVKRYSGQVIPNSYLVKVKEGSNPLDITSSLALNADNSVDTFARTNGSQAFNGFKATLDEEHLRLVLGNPEVEYVEEDGVMFVTSDISNGLFPRAPVSQTNAPWNLARLSQDAPATNPPFTYIYSPVAGQNVDIYILDTGVWFGSESSYMTYLSWVPGVLVDHDEFGGRASWGATFGGYPDVDGNGHGTHLAGIAAGKTFGVAKLANIIAVKVLSDAGYALPLIRMNSLNHPPSTKVRCGIRYGMNSIAGLSFVVQSAKVTGHSSVVLLALGGSPSTALDNAVLSVINSGISVVTVAGGSNTDASNFSPARVVQAITVAASTQSDSAASFSNFGSIIDLYAPGQNIISAGIASPSASVTFSGVSMAGAHVAGLAAYLLSLTGPIPPATVISDLITMSLKNALTGVPAGTPNRLASNNVGRIGITI